LPGGTKENDEKPYSGQPVSGQRFEPGTSECEAEVLLVKFVSYYNYSNNQFMQLLK
jgi:hypothetical protein